jgi:hypothetical protein
MAEVSTNNVTQLPSIYYNIFVQWNAKTLLSQKEKNPTQANNELAIFCYFTQNPSIGSL